MANKLFSQTIDDDDKVIRATLDSASSVDLDDGAPTANVGGSGTTTYNPFFPGVTYIKWTPSGAEETALETTAHVHWEVEKEFFENLAITTNPENRMFTLGSGGDKAVVNTNTITMQLGGTNSAIFSFLHSTNRAQDFTVFDIHLTATGQDVYVDNIKITENVTSTPDFATINLAASQTGGNPWNDGVNPFLQSFKNIYTYSALQLGTAGTVDLFSIGDSQERRGLWPVNFTIQNQAQTGNTNSGDGVSSYLDQGCSATIARDLGNLGYDVDFTSVSTDGASVKGSRVFGVDGSITDDLITQINLMPSDLSGVVVKISCGTNDISTETLIEGWQAILQGRIDVLVAKGPAQIFMSTVTSRALAIGAGLPESWYEADVDTMNDAIRAVAANTPNMFVFDMFAATGGGSPVQMYFEADSVPHYTLDGQRLGGETFVAEFLNPTEQGTATLTTPFSIGTNNGPMFSATSSQSIAVVEASGFLNDRPGWASLLKTNDVLVLEMSDGTKMYTVTVNQEQRIITLSTGLTIT